jgi:OmcA/MtrC family decaheme c-type cytochrome
VVYHRGFFDDFRVITPFPGALNNCNGCHLANTFYPQDPTTSTSLATTVNSNNNSTSPAGTLAITAAAAVCSACHVDQTAKTHMQQNGGNFAAVKDANSHVASSETCVVCHGQGAIADVAVVHNLSQYH